MGMLTLAGAVSGGGKALQQGLQQTQQFMSQSMLLKEREDMELKRLKLTFANDRGLLQERAKIESAAADKRYSRDLDLEDMREDAALRRERIGRDAARTDEATKYERQKERDTKAQENAVTSKVLDASYDQQKEATKAKQDRAKEERDRQAKREEIQTNSGTRLVEQMLQNQRPIGSGGAASSKLDGNTNAQLKVYADRIGRLEDEMNNVMTTKERRVEIQKEIAKLEGKQNELLGMQSSARERPQYRFPD